MIFGIHHDFVNFEMSRVYVLIRLKGAEVFKIFT